MKIKNFFKFTLAVVIAAMVICSPAGNILNGSEGSVAEAAKKPTISKKKATLTVGKSMKLKVKNGTVKKWTSSRKKVATVSSAGKVTAKKAGVTTITAVLKSGKKLSCKVTVRKKKGGSNNAADPAKPDSEKGKSSKVLPNGKKISINSVDISCYHWTKEFYKTSLPDTHFYMWAEAEVTGIKKSDLKYEWSFSSDKVLRFWDPATKTQKRAHIGYVDFGEVYVTLKVSYEDLSMSVSKKFTLIDRAIEHPPLYPDTPETPVTPDKPETPATPDEPETPEKVFSTVEISSKISMVTPEDAKYVKKDNFTLFKVYTDGSKEAIGDEDYEMDFDSNDDNTAIIYFFYIYGLGDYEYEIPMDLSNDSIYALSVYWKLTGQRVAEGYTFPKEDFIFSWVYDSGKSQDLTTEEYDNLEVTNIEPVKNEYMDYTAYNVTFKAGDFESTISVGFVDED